MTNNPMDKSRRIDSCEEKPLFGKAPQSSFVGYFTDWLLSHWKVILFIAIVLIIGLSLWWKLSSNQPAGMATKSLPVAVLAQSVDKTMIEGIYYGEYVDGQSDEPLTASVTRSSYGQEHYLLSAQGQVYDFYFNRATGTLESQVLGHGEISVDSVTTEIIIRFNGWIFKHSN